MVGEYFACCTAFLLVCPIPILAVWVDVDDMDAPVPVFQKAIIAKVSRLSFDARSRSVGSIPPRPSPATSQPQPSKGGSIKGSHKGGDIT